MDEHQHFRNMLSDLKKLFTEVEVKSETDDENPKTNKPFMSEAE